MPPELTKGMYWFGLVAGWIVVLSPASLAAFATAVPMLWKIEPGFDVAMPTFCAPAVVAAAPAVTASIAAPIRCFMSFPPSWSRFRDESQ